ncbi:ATP-grasp domain-containing protein [Virgibacillus sp. W0181]|uniref:ATP-grasp domain-containing protein n=1 Tax=Virgibacillus sp. W0181 TaxID=3391581 RepID=UPI003F46E834
MDYNGWLIYTEKDALENKSYIDWFIHEAKLQNISLTLILREELTFAFVKQNRLLMYNNKPIELPEFAVVRTIEPFIQMYLSELKVHVFNSCDIALLTNHKSWTYHEARKLNIPMVDTFFLTNGNNQQTPPLPYPFVVKDATGRGGKQVHYITGDKTWYSCLNSMQAKEVIVQACNVKLGQDVRVFVVGKEIIGAVLRINDRDFRANYKLGGAAVWYDLRTEDRIMIQRIVDHFDFDLVGIDFLIGQNEELLFNEIEDVVGSRILSAVSDINLLGKYVTHIKSRLS